MADETVCRSRAPVTAQGERGWRQRGAMRVGLPRGLARGGGRRP